MAVGDAASPEAQLQLSLVLSQLRQLPELVRAQELLATDWGVSADVWSATSWTELRREALACESWNMLHPSEPPRVPYVASALAELLSRIIFHLLDSNSRRCWMGAVGFNDILSILSTMKALVLTCDRYRVMTEHMILQYERLWPDHPFQFRIPWQELGGKDSPAREYGP